MSPDTPYRRPERVAHQILQILGDITTRYIDISNLGFITFTHVHLANDLKYAKVYFSVINPVPNMESVTQRLNAMQSAFRKYLAAELKIRYTPELTFIHDETLEYAEKLDKIFDELHQQQENDDPKSE